MTRKKTTGALAKPRYDSILADAVRLIEAARHAASRSVNAVMTATYWALGRRIVEQEQQGASRAGYGEELMDRLARDLTARFGRGFGRRNLFQMRAFYLAFQETAQTAPSTSQSLGAHQIVQNEHQIVQTVSALSPIEKGIRAGAVFPLPWSHYVRLLAVRSLEARRFYEAEALRGGWSVRQLDRQIGSRFYERTALSRKRRRCSPGAR